MKRIFSLLVTLWLCSASVSAQQLPLEAFASIPDVSHVTMSPNGKKIASLVRLNTNEMKGSIINILDIDTRESFYPLQTDNEKFVILSLQWASDDALLIKAKFPAVRYGTPTTETRLMKYSISKNKTSSIISSRSLKKFKWMPQIQSNIIDYLPNDKEKLLLGISGLGNKPNFESVININLNNGAFKFVQPAEPNIQDWITDRQHKVRIGIYHKDSQFRIYEQADTGEDRRVLWEFEAFAKEQVWPMGFAQDPNILYVKAYHDDLLAIFKVNLTDPKLTKELVFSRESYDVEGSLIYSSLKQRVIGINDSDESEYTFWDDEYVRLANGLNKALPDYRNYITQFSDDERRYIVYSTNAKEAGIYLFGDRDAGELLPIAYRYKELNPELLADTKTLTYKARDGLEIEAFLTTPQNKEAKNLPTIIFPHGGPISYDSNSFDYWTQFLANRGYAVFRMNFRGSSGYGFDFMQAGLKSWGLDMQNDVEDGTRWLIEQGVSDPKKICIVGASYGGYVALMGVATTKDLYQCAVSVAGVTDVEYLVKSSRRYTNFEIVKKQIGDDYDALYEHSPLGKAKDIHVPVLLIHGDKDRVVRVQHSEDMFDKLDDLKKPVEYIELENGDHYLSNNEHRIKTFIAIEKFLHQNLH
ncbi:S9 family peptidase [Shewanella sp. 10N.286.52.B9]|uniref:alpha/beta hydrolase family protein n=1 Tax=Shewanella sp. 10N.286.52.B9 TaxID=1880837 RepID=UPI000C844848|nr:S9 family peptidase [Shewanella sp. 10N.286.52.B9]PMG41103.1 peptidase S9 [Shewanella sp. 10N.286.52.B9]